MKRKFLLSILAVVPAALMPLAGQCQAAPAAGGAGGQSEFAPKYEVFAGYGYTSLNQVNQSRYGLQGVNLSVARNLGKYFGIKAQGAFYKYPVGNGNPGDPSLQQVLMGPEVHSNIYGHIDGFIHVLLGGAHTGGEQMTPKVSFAGSFGGGMDYKLSPRLSIRATGDAMESSFSFRNNSTQLGNSPHRTRNPQAAIGVVYKF